jgi:serine/threonine protein kinase
VDKDPTSSVARVDSDGASTLDLSGRCVGSSYILIRPIGQGATGTVWRGVDRSSGEAVAVKLLHASLLRQPKLVTRFVQERTILLMLQHRNVVRVRDLFSVGESLGLVMDLVSGGSLRQYLREHHTVPAGEAARLAAQVAAALAEAHELGVIHRDLKPDNIMLLKRPGRRDLVRMAPDQTWITEREESYDFVKVLDFGIVKAIHEPRAGEATMADTALTAAHIVRGTPAFIAPEQAMGTELDARADIYATGCVAYWLLTGQFVFTAETPMGLLLHHAQTPPAPPSSRTDLPIPPALDRLVLSCLAKDPAERPQSARELSRRLAEVDSASAWTQDRARSWWATHQPVRV